jgi:hypothetical protein
MPVSRSHSAKLPFWDEVNLALHDHDVCRRQVLVLQFPANRYPGNYSLMGS